MAIEILPTNRAALDKAIRAKATELQKTHAVRGRLNDGGGLILLLVRKDCVWATWWRFNYTVGGERKTISLGAFPQVTLPAARQRCAKARELVASGIDPSGVRKTEKAHTKQREERARLISAGLPTPDSFEFVAREWWAHTKGKWTDGHADRTLTRLVNDVFPYLGSTPINAITAINMLDTIRRIEGRGAIESARRTNQACEGVFSYAIGTGRCDNNPSTAIRGVLKPAPRTKNFARVTGEAEISALLANVGGYKGGFITRCALRLMALLFVRPNELAGMEWAHIDTANALWTIPAHKKKQSAALKQDPSRVHLVPLSCQALAVLEELRPLTGRGRYAFTSNRTEAGSNSERHITIEALLAAIRRMGYGKDDMTTHGFRGIASTQIREVGQGKFREEVIEAQLAHAAKSKTQAAYDHAIYLPERTALMQWWADYLDGISRANT